MRSARATICPGWASRQARIFQLVPGQLYRLAPQGGGAPGEVEGGGPGGEGCPPRPPPPVRRRTALIRARRMGML